MTSLAASKPGSPDLYAETTGETGSVPLSPGLNVGQGYSRIGHTTRGLALELSDVDVTKATQNAISYRLVNINSYESLAKELKISTSAAYSGSGGSASARVSMYQSAKLTTSKAYALVSMTVHTHTETIRNPRFNADALARASSSDLAPFLTTYGDTFLYRIVKGAELFALLELSMTRSELQKKLDASAKAGMGGFSAKASMTESLSSLIENNEVRITYVQSGGGTGRMPHPVALTATQENKSTKSGTGALVPTEANVATTGGPLILSLNEFMGRVRDFADEARSMEGMKNSVVLLGDAVDYNVVQNKPASFSVKPKLPTAYALEDLGALRAKVADQMDLAEEVLAQPEKFPSAELTNATAKLAYMQHLDKYVERLTRELVTFPRLADSGRPNIKIPTMSDFMSNSRAADASCGLPTDGNVEATLDCLFATKNGGWRLRPTQLPIRVMTTRQFDLHGNGPPYSVQRRVSLRDADGTWVTNAPPKRVLLVLQTEPQDAYVMPRWKQTGAVIDKDEVVLNFQMVNPGYGYAGGNSYRAYLWICPDLCDPSTLRMEDVPRDAVQQASAPSEAPDPKIKKLAPTKVKPKAVAPVAK